MVLHWKLQNKAPAGRGSGPGPEDAGHDGPSPEEERLTEILRGLSSGEAAETEEPAPRSRPRRWRIALAAAGVVVALTAAAATNLLWPTAGRAPSAAVPETDAVAEVSLFETPVMASRFVPTTRVEPPYRALSGDEIEVESGKREIRLAFAEGIGGEAICRDGEDLRFPCGLMARAAMHRFLQDTPARCVPVFYWRGEIRHRCFSASGDLARLEIAAGFARPDAMGRALYAEALGNARETKAGAWNGGWTLEP